MASYLTLQSSHFYNPKVVESDDGLKCSLFSTKINVKEQEKNGLIRSVPPQGFLFSRALPSCISSLRRISPRSLSSMASSADRDQCILEEEYSLAKAHITKQEFNRVNCLVWVLHESARSFSLNVQSLEFARREPALAMAWMGVDVHAWHKHIAYQVAVYALLKAAIEVEVFLSHKRCNHPSPVHEILSPETNFLGEHIESQLNMRDPRLVQWFRMAELPRIAGLFIPLFKKWSTEYAGSGVAGMIMAITCCAAVSKLGSGRISCPQFSNSINGLLIELVNMSYSLVPIDKLHHLATEAGFEGHFLSHFGSKVLPSKNVEDMEFWIGLVQSKISRAFHRESVITDEQSLNQVQEHSLATLGLFAYLGRETRLFLSRNHVEDLDEQVKDFINYMECGVVFVYPEFSDLSEYQLLMEVIVHEIGWLKLYAAFNSETIEQNRRSKLHLTQAEKEIILYAVFTVCYDVILGFAHYTNSSQRPLDAKLLEFLLHSQSLLSRCMQIYCAAYDITCEMPKLGEKSGPELAPLLLVKGTTMSPLIVEAQRRSCESRESKKHPCGSRWSEAAGSVGITSDKSLSEIGHTVVPKRLQPNFLRKTTAKLVSASIDVWMGTQLLFVDIADTWELLMKQLYGHKVTKRERRKMKRTLTDLATLVPVTILMLLPVSAVGHAAMLAAIKRYMPSLIPSPYSTERLNLVKQLKRTKNVEIQSRSSAEDSSTRTS